VTETTKYRECSQYAPNKSKTANGRHFETKPLNSHISAILLPSLMKFGSWRILAVGPYSGLTVEISNFWTSKMAAVATLKITKIATSPKRFHRSLRNLLRWCKMCLITAPTVKNLISKTQNGGRPPFSKPINLQTSATFRRILMKLGTVMHIGPQNLT